MSISIVIITVILHGVTAAASTVPFLPNLTFVPISTANSTIETDRTCDQCLCDSKSSHAILNCFPNDTCQFFADAPRTYKLQPIPNAILYFPRKIVPNASENCTPNTSYLLSRLNAAVRTQVTVRLPSCLLLDDHGYLVTVSTTNQTIVRFYPNNLTAVDQPPSPAFSQAPIGIAYNNGAYYVGFSNSILVVDSSNMSQIHNISTPLLSSASGMIFLNGGQQMIVVSFAYSRLVFFNRSSFMPHNYDAIGYQTVSGGLPHGLAYVNDTFFYLASARDNAVYAYTNAGNLTSWVETVALNASSVASSPNNGYHISIDTSGRYWFSLGPYGTKIFDRQGLLLGSFYPTGSFISDTLITDNYVVYVSDTASGRIIRTDPNLQC
jgi:hypothetical protein